MSEMPMPTPKETASRDLGYRHGYDTAVKAMQEAGRQAIADIVRRVEEANASPVIDFSTRGYESRKVKDELQKIKEEYGIK